MADISQIKLPNGDIFDLVDGSKSTATNWVNGSATGSVRTVNSKAEDSSYTMGTYAVAEGNNTKASGEYGSHAEGASTVASGNGAHAEGLSTTSSNYGSHAEGMNTTASGYGSHAEGQQTIASGSQSHAEGNGATASGDASHAEGAYSQASGKYSHASGLNTIAQGYAQTVIGQFNTTSGSTDSAAGSDYSFIIGNGSSNFRHNALTVDWAGNMTLQGKLTVGTAGTNSLDVATMGQLPTKTSDLVNDSSFISDSAYIHTDNNYTTIEKNKLNGIAEGAEANVNANWNENDSTSASYIQNRPFYLEEDAEAVIFEQDVNFANTYNGINWNNFSYSFYDRMAVGTPVKLIVDDITLDATIETEGTNIFIGIRDPSDSTRASTNHIGLGLGGADGYAYQTIYVLALASMVNTGTHHVKLTTIADVYHKIDNNFIDLEIENGSGFRSVQQKGGANANGDRSSAFGAGTATGGKSHAEGNATSASGACTHAEGSSTTASAQCAHAEGSSTTASGECAHAEGAYTTASGQASHAEGGFTTASGLYSHAEGGSTTASGNRAHAEGYYTTAKNRSQHVFGEYNIADPSTASAINKGNYIEIVGNGTGASALSNARTLDWSGNEWLAGKLTIGTNPTAAMDVVTKQYMENQGYLTIDDLPVYDGTVE